MINNISPLESMFAEDIMTGVIMFVNVFFFLPGC